MSSFTKINHRQPVDFIKQDHQTTVEALKRFELKLAHKYFMGVIHYQYRQEHDHDFGSTSPDDCCVANEQKMEIIQDELWELYQILKHYYHYQEGYRDAILSSGVFKQIPIDWNKCSHDGFWDRDPTKEIR